MTRASVHARRPYLHKDLAGGDNGPFDLRQTQAIGGAVDVLNDRPHHITPRRRHGVSPGAAGWVHMATSYSAMG
jgi:hypothetical protein